MAKKLFAGLCLLSAAPATADKPAWEEASRYICRAGEMRKCEATKTTCEKQPGAAVFLVDFKAETFKPFASDPKFAERIVFKRYKEYANGSTVHVVMLDGGARVLQFTGSLRTYATEKVMPAVFISAYGDEVVTHYLKCAPSD